jgi:hypothetical protein
MSEFDSFVNLLKYQNTTKIIQLENYTTELFVFVLNYLKYNNKSLLNDLLKKFGFASNIDGKKLYIKTQHRMIIDGNDVAIPDIYIEYNKRKIIIEVKVDSNLKFYDNVNQIEYYKNIRGIDQVYLLSKRILEIKTVENRILWSNIYDIINNTNDFVLNTFIKHFEEHGMATYKLTKGIFNAVSSIENLQSLLEQSWIYDKYDYSFTRIQVYNRKGWISCYIKNTKKEHVFWVGQIKGDNHLYFELLDKKVIKKSKNDNYEYFDDWAFDTFNLEEIIELSDFDSQKIALNGFFKKMMKKYEKYI